MSVEGRTECFHSAFQLKTSPTLYLANGVAGGDKNRCGKHFEKFTAGSPGREAFLLWGRRRGAVDRATDEKDRIRSTLWHLM